jgi:4-hydroxythreonine-4-phosphate dehydrogenase
VRWLRSYGRLDHAKDRDRKKDIQDFSINKPKIAVLGLNPHCGDGGVIGKEDIILQSPCLKVI